MKKSNETPFQDIPARFSEAGLAFIESGRPLTDPSKSAAPRAIWLQGIDFLREAEKSLPNVFNSVCDFADYRAPARVLADFQHELARHPYYAAKILEADPRWKELNETIAPIFEKWHAEYQAAQSELQRLHQERDQAERELARKREELERSGPVASLSARIAEISNRMIRLVSI
jgi:hypothetical protein